MALLYFLLVFDAKRGSLQACEEYVHSDIAMREFAAVEAEHQEDESLQVVLLTADSLETLKATHGHYFNDANSEDALAVLSSG